mgnify:CR=1 FL=1
MFTVANIPPKAQYLTDFSFPLVIVWSTSKSRFEGGRPGYDKERLLFWLLIKKSMNWDYRTVAALAGVSHPTLIRANRFFLEHGVYDNVFVHLVKIAYKKGLIKGKFLALDSSFVQTFSGKEELGSEGWNDFKDAFGFKLHVLIDAETSFPIAVTITNGNAADCTLAIPLLKEARKLLKRCGYVVADKGYDDSDIVNWVNKMLKAKAGIPIKKIGKRGRNYTWIGAWRNFQLKRKGRSIKKSIYSRRSAIERFFSVIKRVFHLGKEETRGLLNFAKNVYLSLISYMLKRFWIAKLTYS